MAVFMKYGDVDGGATAKGYDTGKWMPLKTISTNVERAVEMTTGEMSNRSRNLPQFEALSFEKEVDMSTKGLATEALKGKGVPVFIDVCEPGEKPTPYMQVNLKNAILKSWEVSADGEENTETGTIAFSHIEWKFTEHDASGKVKGSGGVQYDLEKGSTSGG